MWGGALYVKAGAIVPTWPQKQHIEQGWNDKVIVKVWPTADGEFVLHEDDGISLGYRSGKAAKTKLSVKKSGEGIVFAVGKRQGAYKGMPQARAFEVEFHLDKRPASVMLGTNVVTYYLPFLLLSGTIAGVVVGIAAGLLISKVKLNIPSEAKSSKAPIVTYENATESAVEGGDEGVVEGDAESVVKSDNTTDTEGSEDEG